MHTSGKPADLLETLLALHNEAGWLLNRAQMTLDKQWETILQNVSPRHVCVDVPSEAQVIHAPVKTLRIFVPEFPPLLRVFSAPAFAREIGYTDVRDRWYSHISNALETVKALPDGVPFEKALVVFTYHFGDDNRKRDPDRFAAKFITDALAWSGIIKDDSIKNVITVFRGRVNAERQGTEVMVADLYRDFEEYLTRRGLGR
ncbi:MAG: hypothetical protein RDU41_05485 [Clostridia bacterium]|nr:hypothetical protein [Clostridia bacterium]